MPFATVYPLYVKKVERKGRSVEELNAVITWLTGFTDEQLYQQIAADATFTEFFDAANLNGHAELITGSICGVKIQEIEDPLMKKIRFMDKIVDELAQGRPLEKICRQPLDV